MNRHFISLLNSTAQRLKKSDFFRHGVPLCLFVLGGSFFLAHFMKMKLEYKKLYKNEINFDALKDRGVNVKKKTIDIEEELENIEKENENRDWKNVRAPRFWEDNEEFLKVKEEQTKLLDEKIQAEKLLEAQNSNV